MGAIDHSNDSIECPICHVTIKNLLQLATHLVANAGESEAQHVMWLNRFVTKDRVDEKELHRLLTEIGPQAPGFICGVKGGRDKATKLL